MMGTFPSPCPPERARRVIEGSQDLSRPGFWLALRHDGAFVGAVGISPVSGNGAPTLAYFLDPAFWGRGLMAEALTAFVPALDATVFEDNPASARLLLRSGFRETERMMEPSAAREGVWPSVLYRRRPGT